MKASPDGLIFEIVRFKMKERGTVTNAFVGKSGAVSLAFAVGQDATGVQ